MGVWVGVALGDGVGVSLGVGVDDGAAGDGVVPCVGAGVWPAYPSCASHPGPGSRSGRRRPCPPVYVETARPVTSSKETITSIATTKMPPATAAIRFQGRSARTSRHAGRGLVGSRRQLPLGVRRARRRPAGRGSVTAWPAVPAGVRPDAAGAGPGAREALEGGGLGRRDPGAADAEEVGVDRAADRREDAADRGTDDGAGDADGGEQDGGAHGGQGARGHLDPVDLDTARCGSVIPHHYASREAGNHASAACSVTRLAGCRRLPELGWTGLDGPGERVQSPNRVRHSEQG